VDKEERKGRSSYSRLFGGRKGERERGIVASFVSQKGGDRRVRSSRPPLAPSLLQRSS